ncbi:MAG: insulinase family protein [Thermoanaerobaculia bacterium]|nr:insulinase family protein [Thermoanaerobaculia bacterium]
MLVIGDVEPQPTLELVRKYYGGWKPGYQAPQVPAEPEQTAERRVDVSYPGNTLPIVWLGYKAEAYEPSNRTLLASQVLCELLFGETSELYRKLVLEDQVVESLQGELGTNRDPGLIDVIARVKDPANVDSVLAAIDAAIAHSQQQPPSPEKLAAIKSRLRYSFLMSLDSPPNVARQVVRLIAVTGSFNGVEETYATFEQVTAEDVLAAAQRYLVSQRRTIAVLRGEG